MHASLQIIKQEHLRLAALLQCLDGIMQDVAAARSEPDFQLYHTVISYLENFLFRYHHPKEDQILFPRLRERFSDAEKLTRDLEQQHERGDVLLDGIRNSLEMYERHGGDERRGDFERAVHAYQQYEWEHMRREETELIPLAREHLSEEDWREIDRAFSSNSDPLFGEKTKEEFRRLFREIANRAPAPHGLG
ncbi:MAG: hemerythrin domain-containing protein [Gammaproteobacteria bacterium]|nr:hemerythrin domain-containing protein [Gammaproteobacteria bacterium]